MEELIRQSTLLRDMIETDIQNTANDLEAQRLAVNYAFRNRIHEVSNRIFISISKNVYFFKNVTQTLNIRPNKLW